MMLLRPRSCLHRHLHTIMIKVHATTKTTKWTALHYCTEDLVVQWGATWSWYVKVCQAVAMAACPLLPECRKGCNQKELHHILSQVFGDSEVPSVLCCCWLGVRKDIQPVKTEWWVTGMVICLEWDAYDATATPSSLAPVKSRMVYLSGADLPRLSWKKGC